VNQFAFFEVNGARPRQGGPECASDLHAHDAVGLEQAVFQVQMDFCGGGVSHAPCSVGTAMNPFNGPAHSCFARAISKAVKHLSQPFPKPPHTWCTHLENTWLRPAFSNRPSRCPANRTGSGLSAECMRHGADKTS
jgi:hypothetical protein